MVWISSPETSMVEVKLLLGPASTYVILLVEKLYSHSSQFLGLSFSDIFQQEKSWPELIYSPDVVVNSNFYWLPLRNCKHVLSTFCAYEYPMIP